MTRARLIITILIALVAGAAALAHWVLPGLSSARPTPPGLEVAIATWLLRHSVPEAMEARTNPLAATEANLAQGAALFHDKCETCHAYDGSGRTQIGAGEYPRVPSLR